MKTFREFLENIKTESIKTVKTNAQKKVSGTRKTLAGQIKKAKIKVRSVSATVGVKG